MFGQIAAAVAPAVIGGIMGNRAAKHGANAQRFAAELQAAPFRLKEPFLRDLYSGGQGALSDALATGAFTGSTYAGLDPMQREGIAGLGGFGRSAMGFGTDFMNRGGAFAQNAQDIFNRTQGRALDDAISYATSSPQADAMVDAAMRDSTRRLNEQTLPGIGLAASGTGNTNNTRRFMNEAIAQARYDDRRADVRSNIGRDLVNQYLRSDQNDFNNMLRANQGLRDVFSVGTTLAPAGANALSTAGGMLQTDAQGQLDAQRDLFERQRDFALNQYGVFGNLLGDMPNVGQVRASTANPYTAALSGAMMGAGFGGNMYDYFNRNRQPTYNPNMQVQGASINMNPFMERGRPPF